jgi:LuxR family maltose regulon positive regulatory protein
LAAFAAPAKVGPSPSSSHQARSPSLYLSDPLTARELDILILLRKRLSAKEIARELDISTVTVNSHCAHLYRKLGVNTRRDAIAKADELRILPPH